MITVHREFRPGHDRSRQTIRDGSGNELLARDALPQLARLGHHESAQVIFAAQHAAGRQVPADISDFKTVLCFYLRLEDVPKLLSALRTLHEERTVESEKLAGLIEQIEYGYRERLRQIEVQLAAICANPPWGDLELPTGKETEEKVKLFVLQAARLVGQEMPASGASSQLLMQAQQWIEAAAARERVDREGRRNTLRLQIDQANSLLSTVKQEKVERDTLTAKRLDVERALKAIIDEESEESLRRRIDSLERAKTEHDARVMVAQAARQVIEAYPTEFCPACGSNLAGPALLKAIHAQCEHLGEDAQALDNLRKRIANLNQLKSEFETLATGIEAKTKILEVAATELDELLGIGVSQSDIDAMEKCVTEFKNDLEVLNQQLAEGESSRQKELKKIKDLQQELKYHEHRDSVKALQAKLTEGMTDVRELLRDYRNLLARLDEVRVLIDQSFKEALDRAIPTLDKTFTKAYTRLTEQLSYDLVRIHHDPERTGSLELRVASTGLPGQTFPANVLNGQAYKALHLVPYFVFSRLQSEIMELDLLLIDDPSESFDTSHVELLIQELAEAARHAQLVVASHEREKFLPHLDKHFHAEPYAVVSVNRFDRNGGPLLE